MNKEWSELNKTMQVQLRNENTFDEGIMSLLQLRHMLFEEVCNLKKDLTRDQFNEMPFMNVNGFHNKTIIYSLWHVFRIEDIVIHTLIQHDKQIFFSKGYQTKIKSSLITTGNELVKQEIVDFSRQLDLDSLYQYINDVKKSTDDILKDFSYQDLKTKITSEDKENLVSLKVVSDCEEALWLIDYWCSKDIRGLIQMPLSRHWIMHIEACLRIQKRIYIK